MPLDSLARHTGDAGERSQAQRSVVLKDEGRSRPRVTGVIQAGSAVAPTVALKMVNDSRMMDANRAADVLQQHAAVAQLDYAPVALLNLGAIPSQTLPHKRILPY